MSSALKGKRGFWTRAGAGGSYRGYKYERAAPKDYQTTPNQHRIGDLGRQVGKECAGKVGTDFRSCRSAILAGVRKR